MIFFNLHTHRKPDVSVETGIRNGWLHGPARKGYTVSCGIHPWFAGSDWQHDLDRLADLLKLPAVVAIGECGLDRMRGPEMELQREVFTRQVILSEQYRKPVIIHAVRAADEIVAIRNRMKPVQPWVIHGFRGNLDMAVRLIRSGCMLSFGTYIMHDPKVTDVFCSLPEEHLFLETDTSSGLICNLYQYAESTRPGITQQILSNAVRIFPSLKSSVGYL